MSIITGIFIPVEKQHMALGRPVNKDPVIVTNNSLMWQRSLFLKIVQVVII